MLVATALSVVVAVTDSVWLVPGVMGGLAVFFLPSTLVLLLLFRDRLSRLERWVAAIPILLFAAIIVLVVVVTLVRPVGVGNG